MSAGRGAAGKLAVTTVTLVGYGSVVGGVGAQAQILVNGKPESGLLEFKPAADPSGYQTFTVSFANPEVIGSIDISLANATPGRALHIKDFLINGVAIAPGDAANASSPGTFDLYVRNIHVDAANHQDWFLGAPTDDDVIDGGAGNDLITGGIGDDIIDGGDGIDTASFTGNVSDYDIAVVDGRILVHDRIAGRDGSDHLANLEFLRFADATIDAGDLTASLAVRSGGMPRALAIDNAGMIPGQWLHHGDGSALHSSALPNAAAEPPASGANRDTFLFGDMAGHGVTNDLKIEPTITADAAHPPAHVAGHEAVIDPGHDASVTPAVANFLTSDHLLFT